MSNVLKMVGSVKCDNDYSNSYVCDHSIQRTPKWWLKFPVCDNCLSLSLNKVTETI